jgi:hypothetical protein
VFEQFQEYKLFPSKAPIQNCFITYALLSPLGTRAAIV